MVCYFLPKIERNQSIIKNYNTSIISITYHNQKLCISTCYRLKLNPLQKELLFYLIYFKILYLYCGKSHLTIYQVRKMKYQNIREEELKNKVAQDYLRISKTITSHDKGKF
jgi:hypothetical protein